MADSKREIERKYEAATETRLPDLTKVAGVSAVVHRGVSELDAVYYDTHDFRLAADSLTLRRRTGGSDPGWHLKFPVAPGVRDEIQTPPAGTLPGELAALLRSRVRDAEIVPVVRLLTTRDVHHLVDDEGGLLAEIGVDEVCAERLPESGGSTAAWTEIEVELADDGDPALLDAVEKRLRRKGVRPAAAASKLARALEETAPGSEPPGKKERRAAPVTAGDHVLAYVRRQAEAIVTLDPAVRRDLPDSVHRMRVATRRLRSSFKTYRALLDRTVTDPVGDELKWLADELGAGRDHEVLDKRLRTRLGGVPQTLLLGPAAARLRIWSTAHGVESRERILAALDGERYLALLESLDALLADPPLRRSAGHAPGKALPRAVLKDYERLAARVDHAFAQPPGHGRDVATHEARKAAKRARYAAEAARPALGKPARKFAKRMKALQSVLGGHQDSVVARDTLRTLAFQAHAAGETAFTWGLLYGEEEASAAGLERELPQVWARASKPRLRAELKG
ncbi:CYTH and CHAD domain-containing protein [Streptomyces sp. NPDC048332]|uniref:CYTH and CHAD domain-containing protein n=1 Tax=Streptomyces sp. NPDC048332 TaxID=3154619 RepID=UPI00342AFC5B